jgi:hypothetical protein
MSEVTRATVPLQRSRRLFVAWQDPESRAIVPVGRLTLDVDSAGKPRYIFRYLKQAETLRRFRPFIGFPSLYREYRSSTLFPLFENRLMSPKRADYADFIAELELSQEAEPFEVLLRSGGLKATDNIEVFPEPELDPETGRASCLFFVRGLRYVDGSEDRIGRLEKGDGLRLVEDRDNHYNQRALLLADEDRGPVGYVPDYLLGFVHDMLGACGSAEVRVTVERVNPPTRPRHVRLMCRLTTCWPTGYQPFSGDQFEPVALGETERPESP